VHRASDFWGRLVFKSVGLEVKSQEIRQLHILYITNIISLLLDFISAGFDTNFFSILVQRASSPRI
jgi:hypothetical protein